MGEVFKLTTIFDSYIGKPTTAEVVHQLSQERQLLEDSLKIHIMQRASIGQPPVAEVVHQLDSGLIQDLSQAISAYFASQHLVFVETVAIVDCRKEGLSGIDDCSTDDPYLIDFTIGNYSLDTMDEALEAALPNASPPEKSGGETTTSVDDVLYEPVDLESERNPKPKSNPVYDDCGFYD